MAYYCLHKLKKWPHEFDELPKYEKAFVIAAVQIKMEAEKKEENRLKNKRRKK